MRKLNNELRRAKQLELKNTLTDLVQAAFTQTNLTSFNPILQNNIYAPLTINYNLLMYMYKTHGIIQTALETPVLDALRGGLELHSDELDADDLKDLEDIMENLGVLDTITEAKVWTRLFGGGAIIVNTLGDPESPLTESELRKGKVEFYAASRWELGAPHRVSDKYLFYNRNIDASRVLTMVGKNAPFTIRWQLNGWGMSEVERMVEDFNAYIRNRNVIYELLDEAKVDVFRFEDFNKQLISAAGTAQVQSRVQLMNQTKNFMNAVVLDKLDEYEQKQLAFSGLAEMMKENRIAMASALRIPMTKLFGISAAGMSSGEDDIENYNAMVESEVRQPLRKVIRKVLELLTLALYGEKFDIAFKFKPLRILGGVEEENIKTQKHTRYLGLYNAGIIDSKELGEMEQKDNLVSIEIAAASGGRDPFPAPPQPPGGGFGGQAAFADDEDKKTKDDKETKEDGDA